VADVPVVTFHDGAYRLDPRLHVDVDVDDFEASAAAGSQAEEAGEQESAIEHYSRAVELYEGDLLAEAPYEDWALLPRESARVRYLDVLDRLTALHLANQDLGACTHVAQLILQQDPCREDAHRLLMRCYARQGRTGQALRQYELCRRALRTELGSAPCALTTALYDAVRNNDLR
jgi:DNA-binding SARP family transcriptional activator